MATCFTWSGGWTAVVVRAATIGGGGSGGFANVPGHGSGPGNPGQPGSAGGAGGISDSPLVTSPGEAGGKAATGGGGAGGGNGDSNAGSDGQNI